MLSKSQHQKVLHILHNKFKNRRRVHNIDLTNVFKCGECGNQITATKKLKYYPRTNNFAEYIYYHCTQISKKTKCSQKPIAEKDLVIQLNDLFGKLYAPQDFYTWAKKWMKVLHEEETHKMSNNQNMQSKELSALQDKLDTLIEWRMNEKIDEETFERNEKKLKKQIIHQKELLNNTYYDRECWHEKVEKSLNLAQSISMKYKQAEPEENVAF